MSTEGPGERSATHCRLRNATLVDSAALQADGRVRVKAGHVQLALCAAVEFSLR